MQVLVAVDGLPLGIAAAALSVVDGVRVDVAGPGGADPDPAHVLAALGAGAQSATVHGGRSPDALLVSAEGRSPFDDLDAVLEWSDPELVLVVGGGVRGATELADYIRGRALDGGRFVLLSGFPFVRADGVSSAGTVAKSELAAGFFGTPAPAAEAALRVLVPGLRLTSVLGAVLSAANAFIHVPPMIVNASNVERGVPMGLYREAYTPAVARLAAALDAERMQIAGALDLEVLPLRDMLDVHYRDQGMRGADLREMVTTFAPYEAIPLPSTFEHRYLVHEVQTTLAPLVGIGESLGVGVETMTAVVRLAELLVGRTLGSDDVQLVQTFFQRLAPEHVSAGVEF